MIAEGVLVGPRAAALLAPFLSQIARHHTRVDGGTLDPEVAAVIAEFVTVSRAFRAASAVRLGTPRNAEDVDGAKVATWLTTTEAARRLGITPRAVVARIERRTLPARRAGTRWQIDELNLEEA